MHAAAAGIALVVARGVSQTHGFPFCTSSREPGSQSAVPRRCPLPCKEETRSGPGPGSWGSHRTLTTEGASPSHHSPRLSHSPSPLVCRPHSHPVAQWASGGLSLLVSSQGYFPGGTSPILPTPPVLCWHPSPG